MRAKTFVRTTTVDLDPKFSWTSTRRQSAGGGRCTWLSKKNGIVLRAPAENLDCPPDLVIAPNDRVKLPVSGGLCQIPAVLFERLFHRENKSAFETTS